MNQNGQAVSPLRVVELFAGVGGFRQGLTAVETRGSEPAFDVVWSNQFEPGCKKQHAASVYRARWGGDGFVNRDINAVLSDQSAMEELHALQPNMLVGGFPCQDYSVALPSNRSQGLQGKKGVLWWSIDKMIQARRHAGKPFDYLMLENVDRLINSPSNCRGRDFAVILSTLQGLGYAIEWRVVNSADYGFPQRRKRTFILAYHRSTALYARLQAAVDTNQTTAWITQIGPFGQSLPAQLKDQETVTAFPLPTDILEAQENYAPVRGLSCFKSAGICIDGKVSTAPVVAHVPTNFEAYVGQPIAMNLGEITSLTRDAGAEYFLNDEQVARWEYLKGPKSIDRVSATGFAYTFTEGTLAFPDHLDKPSRTIITSEGGRSPSRTTHVVQDISGGLRRLTPEELEALNGFPRGFTAVPGIPAGRRGYLMGNALVTGIVRLLGAALAAAHSEAFLRPKTAGQV
jgi:DNA (cytosine-5)-methyltransferase 1